MGEEKYLQKPTDKEKNAPIYQNKDIAVFPYALTKWAFSCPQSAVFKIQSLADSEKWTYMSISANSFVCSFSSDWIEVWEDFLQFGIKDNEITVDNLHLLDFFKDGLSKYRKGSMDDRLELLGYVSELKELSPLSIVFKGMWEIASTKDN